MPASETLVDIKAVLGAYMGKVLAIETNDAFLQIVEKRRRISNPHSASPVLYEL